jgi:nicotinamidase-related amidase
MKSFKSISFEQKNYPVIIMKKLLAIVFSIAVLAGTLSAQSGKKALLIIDIQDFYFPGGKSALVEPEKAASNAALILKKFRTEGEPVIHIRHNSEPGGKINDLVKPLPSEKIISKDAVNSFVGTDLLDYLRSMHTDTLVICGMQTHMCVEAATRAASDYGFSCILIHDACATKDLKFGDKTIKAEDVHLSTLSTLKSYARVISTAEYLKKK